jgi:hypothetical protein
MYFDPIPLLYASVTYGDPVRAQIMWNKIDSYIYWIYLYHLYSSEHLNKRLASTVAAPYIIYYNMSLM